MTKHTMSNFFINAFYHSKFTGKLFVIKASGDVIENDDALSGLMENIKKLALHGIKVLLVYGGGKATDRALEERGIEIKKHEGRRITDEDTIGVMKEVVGGALSLKLYEAMTRAELEGLSFNAVPHTWLDVVPRPKEPVDFGFVGDIQGAHARPINRLFKSVNFIAVPCLASNHEGVLHNINADTVATELAVGAKASKLIFLSNVDGVKIKDEIAFLITAEEIQGLIDDGTVTGGMKVKMQTCRRALENGVNRIHLINGLRANALDEEIFEAVGPGTMLMKEEDRETYMNEVEIQKAISA